MIVHLLDAALTERGHEVVLLASGGSESHGQLVPLTEAPIAAKGRDLDPGEAVHEKEVAARMAARVLPKLGVDVVLNHSWRLIDHLDLTTCPMLTTVHYPLDRDPYRSVFLARSHALYVSISWSQQRALDSLRFVGNVYNGIDLDSFPFSARSDGYLAFLGRIDPDKGLDLAIRAARDVGLPIRVAAKLDTIHKGWFDGVVAPLLRSDGVTFLGEVDAAGRARLLAGAIALLHPSRWSEPFGLAAVEAMACGTPVVALRRGAAEEVIGDGTSGIIVDREDELAGGVRRALLLDRVACRAHVASRFTHLRMAAEYEELAFKVAP
jgi:glycosyltransferase involved in cell wall biosynthesis